MFYVQLISPRENVSIEKKKKRTITAPLVFFIASKTIYFFILFFLFVEIFFIFLRVCMAVSTIRMGNINRFLSKKKKKNLSRVLNRVQRKGRGHILRHSKYYKCSEYSSTAMVAMKF